MSKIYDPSKVPVPQLILDYCERDPRGLYVPFVVLKTDDGKYHFKINDQYKSRICMMENLCSICGQKLTEDNMWLLGGIGSAFDENGAYIDLPIHRECGHYALQVCPYMAVRNYNSTLDLEKLKMTLPGTSLHNPTVDQDRLPLFVFIRPSFIKHGNVLRGDTYVRAIPPLLDVEFWRDGEIIDSQEDVNIYIKGTKWEKYLYSINQYFTKQSQYIDYEDV